MKNKWLVSVCLVALLVSVAQAGLFKNSVDLADLSEVSPEALESLRETEFAVFLAEVQLNTSKAAERRAAGGLKAANQTVDAETLDIKAAKAEQKAATANQDELRMTSAAARVASDQEDIETAKALRKWKAQEQEARQAEVAMMKSALDLAEARRDAARVQLLANENTPSSDKYDPAEFAKSVSKRQTEFDAAARKARDKMAKTDKLKTDWDRLAKNLPIAPAE